MKQLKSSGTQSIPFEKLDRILRNAGVQQFSYETFKAAYDQDPRLQKLVNNYNSKEIFFQQAGADADQVDTGQDRVGQMAKRATDVGAPL